MTGSAKIPILLDTDIGSDIDDAVALAYLLRQPRCELAGITTVTGDVAQRSALAAAVCDAAGRSEVPVHSGAEKPLLHGPGQPAVPQYAAMTGKPHRTNFPANTAVEFLRATIRKRPGELTLLTIGPFTNVALLFAADPEIPSMLKQVVSMAGVFWPHIWGPTEWNSRVDPVANAMVLAATAQKPGEAGLSINAAVPPQVGMAARPPRHVLFGLDVTYECQMKSVEVRKRFANPKFDIVRDLAEVWFGKDKEGMTFHDPLAAAAIFRPELCTYQDGKIISDAADGPFAGLTALHPEKGGPHRVAKTVDADAFFKEYFGVFN